jgi:hypothetical protein
LHSSTAEWCGVQDDDRLHGASAGMQALFFDQRARLGRKTASLTSATSVE